MHSVLVLVRTQSAVFHASFFNIVFQVHPSISPLSSNI